MPLCGAKAKSKDGKPCTQKAMANGRCYWHGGKTPKGQKNALKHGIYEKGFTESEKELIDEYKSKLGTLDEEITGLRNQLARAFKKAREIYEAPKGDMEIGFEGVEKTDDITAVPGQRDDGQVEIITERKKKFVKKRPNYTDIILRLTGRIGKLERIRQEIILSGAGKPSTERKPEFL